MRIIGADEGGDAVAFPVFETTPLTTAPVPPVAVLANRIAVRHA